MRVKSTNSMNNMLPSVKLAHEEAAALSEKRQVEAAEEPAKKRQKLESLKKFYDDQKSTAAA